MSKARVLVAGIGNVFLGDDAFGVAVAQRLLRRPMPDGMRVIDFGIRGLDLTYALLDGYEAVVLVDAAPRGGRPGALYVMELARGSTDVEPAVGGHNLDPVRVLRLAEAMGGPVGRVLLVGCEPASAAGADGMAMGLSDAVRAAVEEAVRVVESVVARLLRGEAVEAC
jgi:hydrogenase maturation protease